MSVRSWKSARGVCCLLVVAGLLTLVIPSTVAAQDPLPTTTTVPDPTTSTTTTTSVVAPTTTTTAATPDDEGTDQATQLPAELPTDPAELAELLSGFDEAVAFEAELLLEYEISVAKLDGLNNQLVELSEQITEVEIDLLDAEELLADARSRQHLAEVRIDEVEAELVDTEERLMVQAVEAYMYGDVALGLAASILAADAVEDVDKSRQYASVIGEHTTDLVEEFADLRVEADVRRQEADDATRDAGEARDGVEERKETLETERALQAQAQADAFIAAAAQQGLIDEVQQQRDGYEGRLRNLRTTSDSISNVLRRAQEGQSLPEQMDGIFLAPVAEPDLGSGFGPRLHPIFGTVRMHNGLDIDANQGQPLRAAADGVVVMAEFRDGYGLTTVIDHGNGLATLYAHQSLLVAQLGDEVQMGEILGLAGSTGWSTGPHVHWEVRVFGNPSDPIPFLGPEELLILEAREDEE